MREFVTRLFVIYYEIQIKSMISGEHSKLLIYGYSNVRWIVRSFFCQHIAQSVIDIC